MKKTIFWIIVGISTLVLGGYDASVFLPLVSLLRIIHYFG